MQTILLIRHAIAKDREKWTGTDPLRPLTKAGRQQAEAIAEELGSERIMQIRTSPALRCVQTVEPLAARAKVELTIDAMLMEGLPIILPEPAADGLHVICAHGDNIPELVSSLGIDCTECRKGSIWMLKRDESGEVIEAAYVKPPER